MKIWESMTERPAETGPLHPVYKTCDDGMYDNRTGYHYKSQLPNRALEHMVYVEFENDNPRKYEGRMRSEISDRVIAEYEDQ